MMNCLRARLILPAMLLALTLAPAPSDAGFGLYALVQNRDGSGAITAIDASGKATPFAAIPSTLTGLSSLAVDPSGNVFVTGGVGTGGSGTIEKFSSTGQDLGAFASSPNPDGIAIDRQGNVYVANGVGPITKFSSTGQNLGSFSSAGVVFRMVFDSAGNLYAVSEGGGGGFIVDKFSATGQSLGVITLPAGSAFSLAVDSANNLYVGTMQGSNGNILKFSPTGQSLGTFASVGSSSPFGLAFDSSGNLYAANGDGGNVEKFSSTGQDLGNFANVGARDLAFAPQPLASVPEPASLVMTGLGLASVLGFARLRRRQSSPKA